VADELNPWDWRKNLPPVPTFSFFGDPVTQAAGAYPTTAPTQQGPAATPAVLGVKPGEPTPMPSGVPLFGFKDPKVEQAAQVAQQVAAGQAPSAQKPDSFNADLLAKVKRGDFNGALGSLSKAMGGGGSAPSGGAASSPQAPHVAMVALRSPEPVKIPAQRMMQGALEQAGGPLYDLLTPLDKQRRKERARYDILAKGGG
jgi:hypothetical protein